MLYYRAGVQHQRGPALSLSRCACRAPVVPVPHQDGAHTLLDWDVLESERDAIGGIQCLPIHVQKFLWAPGTGEEQGVAGKTRQGITITTIRREADSETRGWHGRPIDIAVCEGRIDRVGLQYTQRHLRLGQRQHGATTGRVMWGIGTALPWCLG